MKCFNCGCELSELDYCTNCGADVKQYKMIKYTAARLYNEGRERACVRDLSGAKKALVECLRLDKRHIDARNLLGLIYYETGECVEALSEWVISQNYRSGKNVANEYINIVQTGQGRLETLKNVIRKYNKALELCMQDSPDMAMIQLKKVISMNPNYVRARQLLALLYMRKEEWERARKELKAALKTDCGDLMTLRYLKEVERVTGSSGDKRDKKKGTESSAAVYLKNGNETIIQPAGFKDGPGIGALLQIFIGVLIGLGVSYFLVFPSRIGAVREAANSKAAEYGELIDTKNAEISDLEAKISELQADIQTQKETIDDYSGNGGVIEVNNRLISAAYAYLDDSQDNLKVDEFLDLIPDSYVEETASTEFKDLYHFLKGGIGNTVSGSYYDSGIKAYNAMDYEKAIENLKKAVQYDESNDEALYYLALSYYDSGDMTGAYDGFSKLLEKFPDSDEADKARQHLEEIGD